MKIGNFVRRGIVKTKVLISCAVTAQLICVFVFAVTVSVFFCIGKIRFYHDVAHIFLALGVTANIQL